MRITIFGASGKVGSLITQELLRRGHTVHAFVHSSNLEPQVGLTVVKGDIHSRSDVEQALQDSDAVVSALGSWGSRDKNILSTAMSFIVPAMQARGIRRIVSLTGNLAAAPHEKPSAASSVAKALLNIAAPKILRDGEDHISLLAASDLLYTVVRSPVMTGAHATTYSLKTKEPLLNLFVSRAAVAHAMADLVETNDWAKQYPYI